MNIVAVLLAPLVGMKQLLAHSSSSCHQISSFNFSVSWAGLFAQPALVLALDAEARAVPRLYNQFPQLHEVEAL